MTENLDAMKTSQYLCQSVFCGYAQGLLGAALLQQGVKFLANSNKPGAVFALTSSPGFLKKVALGSLVVSLAHTVFKHVTPKDTYTAPADNERLTRSTLPEKPKIRKRAHPVRLGLGFVRRLLDPGVSIALGLLAASAVNTNNRSVAIGANVIWGLSGAAVAVLCFAEKKKNSRNYLLDNSDANG